MNKIKEVVGLSNRKKTIMQKNDDSKEEKEATLFESELSGVSTYYRERLGIDFGQTQILVHVKTLIGRKYVFTNTQKINLDKCFARVLSHYPLQSIVTNIKVHDDCNLIFPEITDLYPVGSICFSLTNPYYGTQGTVLGSDESLKNNQLKVALHVTDEPNFTFVYEISKKIAQNYLTLANSAMQLAISNYIFSRITGSLYVLTKNAETNSKPVNIGLDLKFTKKNQETPGYTKKKDNTWLYSNQAVNLVKEYITRFPEIFEYLHKSGNDDIVAEEIFGEDDCEDKVKEIQSWLKSLPIHNIERRVCGSLVLETEIVAEIERVVDSMPDSTKTITMQIKPQLLYKPNLQMGNISPDPMARTKIYDRIVNIREGFTVPLGLKGTVIAIHKPSSALDDDEMYDIVFDKEFAGGMDLNCSDNRGYRLDKVSFINLSYGKRCLEEKTGVPGALRALAREKQNSHNFQLTPDYQNYNNGRLQNSAFASFNKFQPTMIATNTTPKSGFKQQQQQNVQQMNNQKKGNKSPFDYLSEFNQNRWRVNKENAVSETLNSKGQQDEPRPQQQQHSSQKKALPNARVNTEFLRKILKIDDDSNLTIQAGSSHDKSPIPPSDACASAKLLSFYQCNSLGCPRYTYLDKPDGVSAQLVLPNGQILGGNSAKSKEEASETVANKALNILLNQPSIQMPNFPPIPPVKWVQINSPHSSKVFVNKSYQDQAQPQQGSKKNINSPNRGCTKRSTAPRFVPLQALKKKAANKSANMGTKHEDYRVGNANKNESKNVSRTESHDGMKESTTTLPRERIAPRHRKTRIAAKFN